MGQVRKVVKVDYGVSYGKRQIQRMLRQLGLYCYKPQPRDYRQPEKADEKLRERLRAVLDALGIKGKDLEQLCIGFADEPLPRRWATKLSSTSFQFCAALVHQERSHQKGQY